MSDKDKKKYIDWDNTLLNNPNMQFQYGTSNEITIEQQLLDEMVYNFGQTVLYLPRTWVNEDEILGEDNSSEFNKAIPLPVFWINSENWEGNQFQINQFGLGFDLQIELYVTENDWQKYITNSKDGNISNEKSKNLSNSMLGEPAVGDIIIFKPYITTMGKESKPLYLEIVNTTKLNISSISVRYGWQISCMTLDYEHNDLNIDVEDADNLSNIFSNDVAEIENEVGSDGTGFGNNNQFLSKGMNKVFDPNNKFKKKHTVKVDNDYEI